MKKVIMIIITICLLGCVVGGVFYYNQNKETEEDTCNETLPVNQHKSSGCMWDKPVIYLYPTKKTEVNVKLDLNGTLTCTYPKYNNEWNVTADTDGTLTDKNGMQYNYLYWECESNVNYDFSKGFCIKGTDSAKFLEEKLTELGLNRKEANEFITYWLPQLEKNEYNIISFQTDRYTDNAKLDVNPQPDTTIRVFMAFKPSTKYVKIQPQIIETPERDGFTLVEWGGSKVEK